MNKIRLAYSISIAMHIVAVAAVLALLSPLNSTSDTPTQKNATITYLINKPNIKEILPNMGRQQQLPPLKINTNNQIDASSSNPIANASSTLSTTPQPLKNITQTTTKPLNYPKTMGNILPQALTFDKSSIQIHFQDNPRLLISFDSVKGIVAKHTKTGGVLMYLQRLARLFVGSGNNDNDNDNNSDETTPVISLSAHILVDKSGRVYSTNFIRRGLPLQESIAYDVIRSLRFNAESSGKASSAIITVNIPL